MSSAFEPCQDRNANCNVVLRRGDHVRAGSPGSIHHDGIYLGDGGVIHLVGTADGGRASAVVRIDALEVFARGRPVTVRPYAPNHDPDAIIVRALSKLGQGNYSLLSNNCQHYARWCATGDHVSEQVSSVTSTTCAVAAPAGAAAIGISMVSSAGIVTGLSGAGIMSGLAAWGAVIGGGAVAGLTVLGAVPGLASVVIMHRALREDGNLPADERAARTAGRTGSAGGAIVGAAGSIAVVSALGAPGLRAAGISSGLAAIGAAIGGGMAAGAMCVIAAPAIAAALLGYLSYRVVRVLPRQQA